MREEDKVPYDNRICLCGHAGRAHGPTSLDPGNSPIVDRTCFYCPCWKFITPASLVTAVTA